jgi:hypothetical protein
MIENNNPFDCRNFGALVPEMVHFCGFGYRCRRLAGLGQTVHGIDFERFSASGRPDPAFPPGKSL